MIRKSGKQIAYEKVIKKALYFGGNLSCNELSLLTGKSIPLVTKVIGELIDKGEVVETGYASSTGGRRPQKYSMKGDLMFVVAVAVDQLITRIALVNMKRQFHGEVVRYELDLKNSPDAIFELSQHINDFVKHAGVPASRIAGVGIGMPGFIDVNRGINHTFFKVKEGNIISYLEEATGLPVRIDNDSSLVALAEYRLGVARNHQNVMVVNIGWGIGLGMILNGSLFRGESGFAGEFSHIPLFTNNKICGCGKMGCLETETSLLVLIQKAIDGLREGKPSSLHHLSLENPEESAHQIMQAALSGDKFAIDIISKAGYDIGRGVAILVHVMNPELIVLSGRGSLAGKIWKTPIQQALNELCIPKIAENVEVRVSQFGYEAELIGASALFMEHYDEAGPASQHKKGNKALTQEHL